MKGNKTCNYILGNQHDRVNVYVQFPRLYCTVLCIICI